VIITADEVKTLLQNDNIDSDLLDLNIPIVEQAICEYCNNHFIDKQFDFFSSSNISFVNSDNSINMTDIENKKLVAGDSIRVYKSLRNNQTFTIDEVSTGKIIVNSIDTINDEDENETVYIAKIKYPIPAKFTAAQMINYNMEKFTPGVKSEKIDDYSIVREEVIGGYPAGYMTSLQSYRQVYLQTLFTDTRMWA
jgi:hypothetical protein